MNGVSHLESMLLGSSYKNKKEGKIRSSRKNEFTTKFN